MNHLISGVVMAFSFLIGFLPLYTSFLQRLGDYDKHFQAVDDRLGRAEKDISNVQGDVRAGNSDTRTRLDQLIKSIAETHELIMLQQSKGVR